MRPLSLTLWVDNFGIKYIHKPEIDHLIAILDKDYKMTIDWSGKTYCGLTLDWNYAKGYVDLSLPGYV